MRAVGAGEVHRFDDRVRVILGYVQAFAAGGVTDDRRANLAEHFDYDVIVGIGTLASHHVAAARFLDGVDVSPEQPTVIRWEPPGEDVEALASE